MKNIVYQIVLLVTLNVQAQTVTDRNAQLIEIADKIETYYIFGEIGKELSVKINLEIENKTFDNLSNQEFADSLSSYLTKNGNDLHFNVLYRPNLSEEPVDENALLKEYDVINRQWNYGFEKVQRLDGNVGYIQYTGFPEGNKNAREILDATMSFVSNTNALIIDLRNNQGGDGKMEELFLSYFFKKRIKLGTSYTRYNNKTKTSYTDKKVKGEKYLNKPIYILVNNRTISAAEALAYNLQQNKRAIAIGEKTYGAANPVKAFFIDNLYQLFIPVSEEQNNISKKNWEHTGIDLDVKINDEKALIKAHILALEKLLDSKIKTELTTNEVEAKIRELTLKLEE